MLVTYVDRCTSCSCSSLRDEAGRRPVPGLRNCGLGCRCHLAVRHTRVAGASLAADAARYRLFRRSRRAGGEQTVAPGRTVAAGQTAAVPGAVPD